MDILLAVGIGVGLASVAGVRAFLPLLVAAAFVLLGLFESPSPFVETAQGWGAPFVGALAVLSVLEVALDKVPALERGFGFAMVLVRAAAGAVLFSSALGAVVAAGLVAGAAIAGVVAGLKVLLRPPARAASSGVSTSFLSLIEDVVGLVGSIIGVFVPFLPVLLVAFLLFFFDRIRRRRGRKFGGLRILGD